MHHPHTGDTPDEAPPSALIAADYGILRLSRGAGRFLHLEGEFATNLLRMIHPDLRLQLHTAILQATRQERRIVVPGVRVGDDMARVVGLVVEPVTDGDVPPGSLLVLFHEHEAPAHAADAGGNTTGRKRAEAALRESVERFRLFVTAVSDTLYLMSADWSEMRSLEGMDFLADTRNPSSTWLEGYIPDSDKVLVQTTIDAAIRDKHIFELEHRVIRADGTIGWTSSRAIPLLDERGEIVEWFGAASDITDRKQAEEAVRESAQRLQRMVNVEGVGILTFDHSGTILHANDAFLKVVGFDREEFETRRFTWRAFTPPEYVDESERQLERLARTGQGGPYEKEYASRDGSRTWMMLVIADLGDGTIVEYATDIGDRKRAEEDLRASEARLRLALEAAELATWEWDLNADVVFWNQQHFLLLGIVPQPNPVTPRLFFDHIHPDDRERIATCLAQAIADNTLFNDEFRVMRDTDDTRWLSGYGSVVESDGDGRATKMSGVMFDISDRKQAEAERERYLAAEHAARAEAEAALQTRDQFLSIASHELRTPLTSLIGYTDMLSRLGTQNPEISHRMTERINRQAHRLNDLVGQLLDVSRLQRGQFAIVPRPLDVASVVELVVGEIRATLPEASGVSIRLERPHEPIIVMGDAQRLEQVMQNLLSNAVKYSPNGGTILVDIIRMATETTVVVADQGIGIPLEAQAHLFEPFYRAANVGTQISGFGLGLHIVREIVERHGGQIAMDSAEGRGTTVRVTLPLADA